MKEPLISVVTITRNRGKLIGRCIQSVLNQTYKNIEHIVVDGASDDETDEVVSRFKDERLVYLKLRENWSLEKTYKFGTSKAKGEYICFLDSDDEYLPTKIEKQVNLIESLPEEYGMVYCWMTYYDSSKNTFRQLDLETSIDMEYVNKYNEYAEKLISVSNGIITYDLIKAYETGEETVIEEDKH